MNKISSMSPVSSAAAREGQGSLKKATHGVESLNGDGGPSSKVALTGMALAMAQAGKLAEEAPAIDEKRVEALRQAIASGQYSIDADRISRALLAMERELPAK